MADVEGEWVSDKEFWENPPKSPLHDALMDASVMSCGKTITIECGSHDTKDAILGFLIGGPSDGE